MVITAEHINNGYTYDEYRQMGKDLLAQGKTTGPKQTESYIEYSRLNDRRMDRLDKTVVIKDDLVAAVKAISKRQVWVVLTELWCGDAAQNVPAIAKMAKLNSKINLRLLLRDENPEVMDAYLTNGSRSIPKIIALDAETKEELFTWGPRPQGAQQILADYRAAGSPPEIDYKKDIQLWYIKDHTETLQNEFVQLLKPYGSS